MFAERAHRITGKLYDGIEPEAGWWKPKVFEELKQTLPAFFIQILEPYQSILIVLDQQLREATAREEEGVYDPRADRVSGQ